jgi:hypothetical protein
MSKNPLLVTHYGDVLFGDHHCEAMVLETGERGFNRHQAIRTVGFNKNLTTPRFRQILAEISPNALTLFDKFDSPVKMPTGATAAFIPCNVIPEFASGVIHQAIDGTLHPQRKMLIAPCLKIQDSLAKVGIAALIDEATGYQYHREPDALQDLFAKLLRQSAADWERRFHPDFYESIYRLFGWKYNPTKPKPFIVGRITLEWVYEPVFPAEILVEIKDRQEGSDKMHQWLQNGGLTLLEKQRDAVMMIARSSVDYHDFENRCAVAFFKRGQVPILYPRAA